MNLLLEYVQLQNYQSRDEPFYKNNRIIMLIGYYQAKTINYRII